MAKIQYRLEIFNYGPGLRWELWQGSELLEAASRGFTGSFAQGLLDLLPKEGHQREYEISVEGGMQTQIIIKEVSPDEDNSAKKAFNLLTNTARYQCGISFRLQNVNILWIKFRKYLNLLWKILKNLLLSKKFATL